MKGRQRRIVGVCLVCIAVLLVGSLLSKAGSRAVLLWTVPEVSVQCGQNVTLPCGFKVSAFSAVQQVTWVREADGAELCALDQEQAPPGVQCDSSSQSLTLNVTLAWLMPSAQGRYVCRLRSAQGNGHRSSMVTLQACVKDFQAEEVEEGSRVACQVRGHPQVSLHWFLGQQNLTGSASTESQPVDQEGLVLVRSSLAVLPGAGPYNCSVWVSGPGAAAGRYLDSRLVPRSGEGRSRPDCALLLLLLVAVRSLLLWQV